MFKQRAPKELSTESLRIGVGIATRGRSEQLVSMLENLACQSLPPDILLVCCPSPRDVATLPKVSSATVIYEMEGLPRQRNRILRAMPNDVDVVVFFDDDFYPDSSWLERVAEGFKSDPSISCITGYVVADGVVGPGLLKDDALALIASHNPQTTNWVSDNESPYGCNMAFRYSAIKELYFDERLVLYGWLEDRDFGARLAKRGGRLIKLGTAYGAHLGIKHGRVSGRKFGYSQVMNPVYLYRKRTMTFGQAFIQISSNFAANAVKSFKAEAYIDRRGRLLGNLLAVSDLLRLRLTPERAASL